MWTVSGLTLRMAEGDYGLELPIKVTGATLGESDSIRATIKTDINGETILVKDFHGIVDNTVSLELTAEETELLPVGRYVYCLDWYQSGNFMCNLVPYASFWVVDKA